MQLAAEETEGFKDRDAKAIQLTINLAEEPETKQLNGNSQRLFQYAQ